MNRLHPRIAAVLVPTLPLLCGALLLTACSGSDEEEPTQDAGDTALDLGGEVDFETSPDVEPDGEPDVEPDTEPDSAPDVEPDTEPDVPPDTEPDVPQAETTCDDDVDNDGDGDTDCEDSDCAGTPICVVCDEDPFGDDITMMRLTGNWEDRVLGYQDTHTYTIPVCPQGIVRVTGALEGAPVRVSMTSDGTLSLPDTPVPPGDLSLELPYTGTTQLTATLTVTQPAAACSSYQVEVAVDCGIVCGDDEQEENDTRATLTDFLDVADTGGQIGEGSARPSSESSGRYFLEQRAADDDWYRVTLCPNGTGELWIDDYGNESVDEGPPAYPVTVETALWDSEDTLLPSWSFDGNGWGLNPLTSDDETALWLRVRPLGVTPDVQLCSSYQIGSSLSCECDPYGTALLGKDESAEGVRIPSGRVSETSALESGLFVCPGGTLRGTITSDDDVTIELFADGVEGEFAFTDAVTFDPAIVDEPGYVSFIVSTTDACATYDLDLAVEGCDCAFESADTSTPEDAELLSWNRFEDGPTWFGSYSGSLALSGGDVDYYQLDDIECATFDLDIFANSYLDSTRTTRTFRVLDANGVELVVAGNRRFSHGLLLRAGQLGDFTPPLFLEITSSAQYVCDTSFFSVAYDCRELTCDDGLDNDGDGNTDCEDADCDTACFERACDDGLDNDDDGDTDCDDEDCASEFRCLPPGPMLHQTFEGDGGPLPFDLNGYALTLTPSDTVPFYTWEVTEQSGWIVEPGSSTDTELLLLGDDAESVTSLGFAFPFFGVTHTEARVGSNGHIAFGPRSNSFYTYFGTLTEGNPVVVVHGQDLSPGSAGDVVVDRFADRVAVSWNDVPRFGEPTNLFRFQAILGADGVLTLNWQTGESRYALVGLGAGLQETPYGGPPSDFR